ncbi:MAG: polyketide synthase [Segniliparus sp.]|uniref:beta-ketoacyl [acyl carrier protein] synthase domain-containing protein n=1 Tax=Segniliparus sp. TaxID=2804064 RepID=UPI003F2E6044
MTGHDDRDPVVVSGFAVETPGGVDSLDGFWSLIAGGREAITPFPRDRGWPVGELLALGRLDGWGAVCDAGGFLDGAAEFDPAFFGISPREAAAMDPQQRVALRVAWRALEHAGVNPGSLAGEDLGCYLGAYVSGYGMFADMVNEHSGHLALGTSLGAVAGRVSHHLGAVGPSLTVDTICASSLTAIGLAVSAIRAGDCDWALAGGVSVMGGPGAFFEFAKQGALSPDGHCRSYSDGANGTLWGEGAGIFLLEPKSRAISAGRRVHGEIRSVGVGHCGRGANIAAPSAAAQERLIRRTLGNAAIPAASVGLVEGHGTATALGDPVELAALQSVYGSEPTALGSLKSNIGHAQAASGALGLAKVLLCGAKGQIAPTRYADTPTTAFDWARGGMRLAEGLEPWEPAGGTRYGAVSSFGLSGTNAHAVVAMPVHKEAK